MKELRALLDRGMSYEDILDAVAAMRAEDMAKDAMLEDAREGLVEALATYIQALMPEEVVDENFKKFMYQELERTERQMHGLKQILPEEFSVLGKVQKPEKVSLKTINLPKDEDVLEGFLKSLGIKEEH